MSTDSDLQRAVLDELRWEPSVEAARIGVTANAGVVTLTRHVQNYSQKLGAEKAASRVKGVKAVAEEIDVKLPYDLKRGDEDIAAAAIDRLGWNSNIPDHAIQVNADGGKIKLTGNVTTWNARSLAGSTAWSAPGALSVENAITVNY
jgi:osmotically-inducible protein OsmY